MLSSKAATETCTREFGAGAAVATRHPVRPPAAQEAGGGQPRILETRDWILTEGWDRVSASASCNRIWSENVHFGSHSANNSLITRPDGLLRSGLGQGFTKHNKAANILAWSALARTPCAAAPSPTPAETMAHRGKMQIRCYRCPETRRHDLSRRGHVT